MTKLEEARQKQSSAGKKSSSKIMLIGIAAVIAIVSVVSFLIFQPKTSGQVAGTEKGKVIIEEFSDFECSWCGKAAPELKKIKEYFKEKIEFNYKHFPLYQKHKFSFKAAEAAECAKEQGKFWEMHDKLFENQSNLSIADLKNYAKQLGLNPQEFDSCLDSGKTTGKVQNDYYDGISKGVQGTPTIFINGKQFNGQRDFASLKIAIENELALKK